MSVFSRLLNLLRRNQISREIDEELQSHLDEAIERGRDPLEARRALGPQLRLREESRDARIATEVESFVADFVFGWRQLRKHAVTSIAAVLSLGLAIGACGATFQLVDALLLRPLPVAEPSELFSIAYRSPMPDWIGTWRDNPYPTFRQLRDAVAENAELIASSRTRRRELTFEAAEVIETAHLQYVSGRFFPVLGLEPRLGRLLTPEDNLVPAGHPVAVVSESYWTTRFGASQQIVGTTFELAGTLFEVVGVVREPFAGIEPGISTDVFVPLMMARDIENPDRSGFRILGRWKKPGTEPATLATLDSLWRRIEDERWTRLDGAPREWLDQYLSTTEVLLEPAGRGFSEPQETYGLALTILTGLAVLVLLITCASVSNLMLGRTVSRARELALRVAIGAGRYRVLRLLFAEAWILGLFAAALGAILSIRLAPAVVRLLGSAEVPLRLEMPVDGRFVAFFAATALVTCLLAGFGSVYRVSFLSVASGLKVGQAALCHRRSGRLLLAGQIGFCSIVVFAGGLFATSLTRLVLMPTGFDAAGLVNLEVVAEPEQPHAAWDDLTERLNALPNVSNAALAGWPLLDGSSVNARVVTKGETMSDHLVEFFCVSWNWLDTMGVPLLEGEGLRPGDTYPGVALVNQTFADVFYGGLPVAGRTFQRVGHQNTRTDLRIAGTVADVKQNELRAASPPVAYVPCHRMGDEGAVDTRRWGTFVVRGQNVDTHQVTAAAAEAVAATAGFRLRQSRTQQAINNRHTIRERLLATLGAYYSGLALLLTGVGLFGMLHYSFRQRRREVGVRLALGGSTLRIAQEIAGGPLKMVLLGVLAGVVLGIMVMRSISSLLFEVRPTDASMLIVPLVMVVGASAIAALPIVLRAVRTDPTLVLRAE